MYNSYGTYDYYNTTTSTAAAGGILAGMLVYWIICIALYVVLVISFWKVFTKAGKPGWASLIPIYNTWVLYEIGDQQGFWCLIPIANIVFFIKAAIVIANRFGKSNGFAALLILLPYVGFPILAFSSAKYTK